ncbi:MAG: DUF3570 domain-containing protein [Bacteroidota bacterium]
MKYLIIGSLAFSQFMTRANAVKDPDTIRVSKTEIEMVYNHYLQNGNNSAVTGGTGTERLIIYGPALSAKHSFGKNIVNLNLGTDVISSASTDKIDFVVSSASVLDARYYLDGNFDRHFDKSRINLQGGVGLSAESDYFSFSYNLGITKKSSNDQQTLSAAIRIFNDDLRWGRLSSDNHKPVGLIYPQELRYKEWYTDYRRNSYNIRFGFVRILNKRNTLGVFPEFAWQKGLLATPFHRVYFNDESLGVEQLPDRRIKGSIALKLNSFPGGRVIIKNSINAYTDNFGIHSLSFENETPVKIRPFLILMPNFRIYSQQGSSYFARYKEHRPNVRYYSSDYDLSSFQTFQIGMGFKYSPQKYTQRGRMFNSLIFRYNYFHRTNNLNAHIFSVIFQTTRFKKSE